MSSLHSFSAKVLCLVMSTFRFFVDHEKMNDLFLTFNKLKYQMLLFDFSFAHRAAWIKRNVSYRDQIEFWNELDFIFISFTDKIKTKNETKRFVSISKPIEKTNLFH
jgi:hypothetical protein